MGDSSRNYILGRRRRRRACFILGDSSRNYILVGRRRRRAMPASSWATTAGATYWATGGGTSSAAKTTVVNIINNFCANICHSPMKKINLA